MIRLKKLEKSVPAGQGRLWLLRQIVAVARATITRPKVLLADEPTGALHSSQGEMIMDLLGELHRDGATIVMVTHNADNAARAQRQIRMVDGWIG